MYENSRARHPLARAAAFALLGFAPACGGADATNPITPPSTVPVTAPTPSDDVRGGACIDGTASVETAALLIAVEALKTLVSSWVPAASEHEAGTAPIPGLSLRIRKVLAGSSITVAGQVATIDIPPVPGVMPRPAVTDPGYVDLNAAHVVQVRAYDAAVGTGGRARAAVEAGVEALSAVDWRADESEIAGCFEALAATTSGPGRRFVGLTDLDQNVPPQSGRADFTGTTIVVFHSGADVNQMSDQEEAFRALWMSQGAVEVRFFPPETMPTVLGPFLTTGVLP